MKARTDYPGCPVVSCGIKYCGCLGHPRSSTVDDDAYCLGKGQTHGGADNQKRGGDGERLPLGARQGEDALAGLQAAEPEFTAFIIHREDPRGRENVPRCAALHEVTIQFLLAIEIWLG